LFEHTLAVLAISILLCVITKKAGMLSNSGVASAFIIGVCIGIFGGLEWLFLLLIFLLSGFWATKHSFAIKEALGVQEGKKGERGWRNAWSTGLVPTVVAVLAYADTPWLPGSWAGVVFATALAAAASDTFASEMGMLYPDPFLITSPKTKVPVGTNGGMTAMGTLWALLAALLIGFCAFPLLGLLSGSMPVSLVWPLMAAAMGFLGCQFDSVLGSLYENKKKLGKHSVNLISITLASILAWAAAWLVIG